MTDVHPSLEKRKIIHIDMDAFYASIEMRDNPDLRNKPIVVGGSPQGRGVVATANYEARKYGIRSAMACAKALRLCPHVIFVRPRFEVYKAVSRQVREILKNVTPLVEPLSLDEAYLDVTGHKAWAMDIAQEIRRQIFETTQLTASAGVAPNKMLAKIASDINKPDGIAVIRPKVVSEFMKTLPVGRIPGVGPVTARRLESIGIHTCGDVTGYDFAELTKHLGNSAEWLVQHASGIDERPVETFHIRKSFGTETTFPKDIYEHRQMVNELKELIDSLFSDTKKRGILGRTVTLKVRYTNFKRITRAKSYPSTALQTDEVLEDLSRLLETTEATKLGVRLLGVSLSNLVEAVEESDWD